MSIRPSSIFNCETVEEVSPTEVQSFVVIGNTALNSFYVAKLLASFGGGLNYPIYSLTTGVDQTTNVNAIESLSYVAANARLTSRNLVVERIHNILTTTPTLTSDQFKIYQEYYFYFTGSGILSDLITAYYTPFLGPWWTSDTHSDISGFINGWTTPYPFVPGHNEDHIATNLANLLGLTKTTTVIARKPSILTTNYILVDKPQGQAMQRQIFYDVYLETKASSEVHYVNRVNNIYIEDTANGCLKNVHYSTSNSPSIPPLNNACVIWANNLYDYVHIVGSSNLEHARIKAPVFYRFVTTIPKVNPAANGLLGNDLSNKSLNGVCLSDGLTTRITFACSNPPQPGTLPNTNSTSINWNCTAYTTDDDLSTFIESDGSYVRQCATGAIGPCPCTPDQTLLIVEATSLNNRRTLQWDNLNLSVSQSLNSNIIELNTYVDFQHICEIVYQAYTGYLPDADLLPGVSCTTSGICNNIYPLDHTFNRESPQTTMLRMLSDLYSGSTFPSPNFNAQNACCASGIVIN